ncbi:hypothetical protein GTA08_BOTSDO04219 [Botryosphaeria dothidea]|uniref:HNH nuclease domain-containing protein n=1 Tax=Botryosphaeria dothidea TaxID=55169 RepID=A0A8H4IVM4_9PEZI|nr:hypothetical protein GTA08_BOTSDO04219 [Botryosphaeria dothidea]
MDPPSTPQSQRYGKHAKVNFIQRPGEHGYDPYAFQLPINDNNWKFMLELNTNLQHLRSEEIQMIQQHASSQESPIENSQTQAATDRKHFGAVQAKYESKMAERMRRRISGQVELIDNQLSQLNMARQHWLRSLESAEKRPDRSRYEAQLAKIEGYTQLALLEKHRYKANKNAIVGHAIDEVTAQASRRLEDDQLIDSWLQSYGNSPAAAQIIFRTNAQQRSALHSDWTRRCADFYAITAPANKTYQWCAITREYHPANRIHMAHIVRNALGELNARYIFGDEVHDTTHGHLYDVRNCIPMEERLEELFDKAQITVVPADVANSSSSALIVKVLDASLTTSAWANMQVCGSLRYADLDGRLLEFKHPNPEHRPRLRYLYWAFCMALLRRQRHACIGLPADALKTLAHRRFWGSPEKGWYRRTTFLAAARRVGDIDDVQAFFGTEQLPVNATDEEDDGEAAVASDVADDVLRAELGRTQGNRQDEEDIKGCGEIEDEGVEEYYDD